MEPRKLCNSCGTEFLPGAAGPCRLCGATTKRFEVNIPAQMSAFAAILRRELESKREYFERNMWAACIVISITLVSPFLGLILLGWSGVVAGLALGAFTYFLGPRSITRVREITRTHFE